MNYANCQLSLKTTKVSEVIPNLRYLPTNEWMNSYETRLDFEGDATGKLMGWPVHMDIPATALGCSRAIGKFQPEAVSISEAGL